MAKTHRLIMDKIQKYPVEIQVLATRSLELAESMPESSVFEELKGVVRQILKEKEESR